MKGWIRTLRALWVPQVAILCVVLLLFGAAINPNASIPAVGNEVHTFVSPASHPATPPPVLQAFDTSRHADMVHGILVPVPQFAPTSQKAPKGLDCQEVHCIALSFDDGPREKTTAKILNILEAKRAAATFFVIGKRIKGNETLIQRMAADGFEIGNHSWSHGDMAKMKPSQIKSELAKTQQAVVAAGGPLPALFRPPYGSIDEKLVQGAGLQTALWNEDPEDWQQTKTAVLSKKILHDAKPGGVVDLHDIHDITVKVLPKVIDELHRKHYHLVTVSQLLHSRERSSHAPFYGYADMDDSAN